MKKVTVTIEAKTDPSVSVTIDTHINPHRNVSSNVINRIAKDIGKAAEESALLALMQSIS